MAQQVAEQTQEFVPLSQVEAKLNALWTTTGGPGAVRTRTSNVVVVLPSLAALEPTFELFKAIAGRYPTRVVAVVPNPDTPSPGIAAQVDLLCPPTDTYYQCVEGIALHVTPDAWRHASEALLVCLLPELPVYLWWRSALEPENPVFGALEDLADMLIVDASEAQEPEEAIAVLAAVSDRFRWGAGDLVWARTTPWREHIAQLFDPMDRRPLLTALERVTLTVGPDAAGAAAALYLTAWLADRLGWRPLSRWRRKARSRELRFDASGREVRVTVTRGQATESSPINRIRLHAAGILPASFTVALVEDGTQMEVTVEVGQTRVRQVHLVRPADTAYALAETLSCRGKDLVFTNTLQLAKELLNPE